MDVHDTTDPRRAALCRAFKDLHDQTPEWAFQFPPSIPFIGKDYLIGESVLIYASAEVHNIDDLDHPPPQFMGDLAWDRYRARYEEILQDPDFFPEIGIAPVDNGGLLTAALLLSERLWLPVDNAAHVFLEKIAVTNWCKFTVLAEPNEDYAGNLDRLAASIPFVVAELSKLRPRVVMLPKTIWAFQVLSGAMRGASPRTHFVPVPQFAPLVVNHHLADYEASAQLLRQNMEGTSVGNWMEHLTCINIGNAWRYLAHLDEVIGQ